MLEMLCFQAQKEYKFKLALLDDRQLEFSYKGSIKCERILYDVCKQFNLKEIEYFGFKYIDTNDSSLTKWVDLNKTIHAQFKSLFNETNQTDENTTISIYFRVKYYTPDPCKLNYEITRYLFYLQLRKDIYEARLPLQFDYAVDLFSYFLQDELGDYNSKRDTHGYSSEFQFMSDQSFELEKAAEAKHAKLKGMSQSTAEMNFLNKAKWLDMYGVNLQPVLDENNAEYMIGLTPTGICVYQNKAKINSYFWPRIIKLNHKNNKFMLTVIEKSNEHKTHTFLLDSKSACKHLWKFYNDHYEFFRKKTVYEEPARISTALITSKSSKNGATSSSEMDGGTSNDTKTRSLVKRVPANRVKRRSIEYLNGIENIANETCTFQSNKMNSIYNQCPDNVNSSDGSNDNQNEMITPNHNNQTSPAMTSKSISSFKYPSSKRRESASESETGLRKKYGSRNRSRNRLSYSKNEKNESDSEDKRLNKTNTSIKTMNENGLDKSSTHHSKRRHHRSHSRNVMDEAKSSDVLQNKSHNKSRRSLNNQHSGTNLINGRKKGNHETETCHETSMDEDILNETEKKRQIRRRKRSKSPGATTKPPEEILQHIKYNLVEPSGLSADQLQEIPYVKVETTAPPFRISPHQKHRRYSPHRRKSTEYGDSKSTISYLRDGTAHIVKTNKLVEKGDTVMVVTSSVTTVATSAKSTVISTGSAINTKLNTFSEPMTNIGFSADSGCEDMNTRQS